MKKTLLILLLFLPIPLFAKEIANYEVIKEYGPYQKTPSEEYPYLSENFIWKEVTELKEYPKEEPGREIFTENYYTSYSPAKVRRVAITNIHLYSGEYFPLTEIEIYKKDEKLAYHLTCTACGNLDLAQFQDGDYETVIGTITLDSIVNIILDEPVSREDLMVKLHFKKDTERNFFYGLLWMENTELFQSNLGYSPDLLYIRFVEKIDDKSMTEKVHRYTKENLAYARYEKEISYTKELPDKESRWVGEEVLYGYKEKWYQSYRLKTIIHNPKQENNQKPIIQKFLLETTESKLEKQTKPNQETIPLKQLKIAPKVESSTILFFKKEGKKTEILQFRHLLFIIIGIVLLIFYLVWRLWKRSR